MLGGKNHVAVLIVWVLVHVTSLFLEVYQRLNMYLFKIKHILLPEFSNDVIRE